VKQSFRLNIKGDSQMNLNAAERRILRAALREFDASHQSDFETLREYHSFLRTEDAEVNVGELAQKLGLDVDDRN
jgi:hypothetical protein